MAGQTLKRATGVQLIRGGQEHSGWLPAGAAVPPRMPSERSTCTVTIECDESGWFLVCTSDDSDFFSDDWFQSLEEAEQHAQTHFGIQPSDWKTLS